MNGQLRVLAAFNENSQKDRLHRSQPFQATHLACHQLLDPGVGLNLGLRRDGALSLIWNRTIRARGGEPVTPPKLKCSTTKCGSKPAHLATGQFSPLEFEKKVGLNRPGFFGGPNS